MLLKEIKQDNLKCYIYKDRQSMGEAAAKHCAEIIRNLLAVKDSINMVFAAAPSQSEMLDALTKEKGIDWGRIRAFHMDEYIGLDREAPQNFGNFLYRELFSKVKFGEVYYINDEGGSAEQLCSRYADLLEKYPADIICLGIGENGHIAFNDPHEADFKDKRMVKIVSLDEKCRRQQVNDGCFKSIDEVPKFAITITLPYFLRAGHLVCTVPAAAKAEAVFNTLRGEIGEKCPATIMRLHPRAAMFADKDSARRVLFRKAVITDEISQELEEAVELAKRYELEGVEIRSVWNKAPENLSDGQIERIKEILKENNLKVVSISSSIFKCNLNEEQPEKFKKTIRLAKELGSRFIRCFSFWKDDNYTDEYLISKMKECEPDLIANGLTMLIEADPAVNLTNAQSLSRVLKKLNSPNFKAIWDPGNDIYDPLKEIPYPDGYNYIKPFIAHMHLKDAVREGDKTIGVAFGTGQVDYKGQFRALLESSYDGFIVMETHYKKGSNIDEELLKKPMGSKFSQLGYESTEECLINLDRLIDEVVNSF